MVNSIPAKIVCIVKNRPAFLFVRLGHLRKQNSVLLFMMSINASDAAIACRLARIRFHAMNGPALIRGFANASLAFIDWKKVCRLHVPNAGLRALQGSVISMT